MSLPPTVQQQMADGRVFVVNQTPTGVPFWDIPELYREDYTEHGRELTRVVDVRWDAKQQFLYDMLGFPLIYPNGGNSNIGLLRRALPDQFPASKVPDMWCSRARLIQALGTPFIDSQNGAFDFYLPQDTPWQGEGMIPPGGFDLDGLDGDPGTSDNPIGPPPQSAPYGYARYALTYRKPLYDLLTDEQVDALPTDPTQGPVGELNRYVERREEYAVENLSVKGNSFYFPDLEQEGKQFAVGQDIVIRHETKLLVYIWHDVPAVPESEIEACQDTVNYYVFDGRYPPGTLLFQAPKKERYEAATGLILWRIVYTWLYDPNGHNRLWRPHITSPEESPAGYYEVNDTGHIVDSIYHLGTNSPRGLYTYADHNTLFQVPPPS